MDLDGIKRRLQAHFSDGLVLIVGSGLSCAEGLPGMGALADEIGVRLPPLIHKDDLVVWSQLEPLLKTDGLESALLKIDISERLQEQIATIVGDTVATAERRVLEEVFAGERELRLSRLIPHLLKTQAAIPAVTTNYDRLVEVAFEEAAMGVDSMFVGAFAGQLDEKEAAMSLLRDVKLIAPRQIRRTYRGHVRLAKPHGSLDWYYRDGKPVRCGMNLPGLQRLIIAPGKSKFRSGYDSPFDQQRERANRSIDAAARFMIVGYGFNDDHLETHLTPAIRAGKPTLLLTRELSPTASALTTANSNVMAIERRDIDARSRVVIGSASHTVDLNLWDLASFVQEVFQP
jgi:hypothetical protein